MLLVVAVVGLGRLVMVVLLVVMVALGVQRLLVLMFLLLEVVVLRQAQPLPRVPVMAALVGQEQQ